MTSSDICTSCTLCCRGFRTIELFTDEEVSLFPSELIQIHDINTPSVKRMGDPSVSPPIRRSVVIDGHHDYINDVGCPNLNKANGQCGVYEKRPIRCMSFKCEVLQKVESGDYTPDQAMELINEVKQGNRELWYREFWNDTSSRKTMQPMSPDPHGHQVIKSFLTDEECASIVPKLLRDEHKILRIPNHSYSGYQGTTKQFQVYNILTHGDIRPLNLPQRVLDLPQLQHLDELWIQAWVNITHLNEDIPIHTHNDPNEPEQGLLACSVYLHGRGNNYTHFEDTGKTLNIVGDLHMVGEYHEHEVKTNVNTEPRVSLAFDIHVIDPKVSVGHEEYTKRFRHYIR